MSLKQKRHSQAHEEENEERWLITYADMITLLMAFFIMMYAMSVVDLKKFQDLSGAMGHVFGGARESSPFPGEVTGGGASLLPGGTGLLDGSMPGSVVGSASLANRITEQVKQNLPDDLSDLVDVVHSDNRVTVRLKEASVLFPLGRATRSSQARRILREIGAVLYDVPYSLRIEGHTCDLPIHTYEYPSNWELSATRAASVMAYLIRQARISPLRVSARGLGDTQPLVPNDLPSRRARNRRVDIVILSDEKPEGLVDVSRKLRPAAAGLRPADRRGRLSHHRTKPVSVPKASANIVPPIRLCPRWDVVGTYFGEATAVRSDPARGGQSPKVTVPELPGLVEEIRPPGTPPAPRPASVRKAPASIVPAIQLCPPWDAVGTRSAGPVDQQP